jgi:hypothetical protein
MNRAAWVLALFVLALPAAPAAAQHLPGTVAGSPIPQGQVELQSRAQLVANVGSWDVLAELLGSLHDTNTPLSSFESVTVGGYYRVIPNLKVGALARLQAGARHDNDVLAVNPVTTTDWAWNDTSTRLEGVLMLDVSPRFQLSFLPTGNWVLMLKSRYEYNTWNGQMSIMARPELTWFWIRDREPVLNVAASYVLYFPLNFGSTLLYQNYPYLSVLWHATPEVGIELSGAYKLTTWTQSDSWVTAGWGNYSIGVQSWVVSLGVVYTPSF